jgi:hypothetical protein
VATWERYFGPKFRLTSAAREGMCVCGGGPQEILAIHLVSSGAHTWSAPKACLFVCYWFGALGKVGKNQFSDGHGVQGKRAASGTQILLIFII